LLQRSGRVLTSIYFAFDSVLYSPQGMNEHAIYDVVGTQKKRPSTVKLKSQWGADIVNLMEEMWVQEPKERPSMTEVVDRLEELYAAEK
jgi:hypothetical protein